MRSSFLDPLPEYEKEKGIENVLADHFSGGVAPVLRTAALRNHIGRMLPESVMDDIADLALYIRSKSREEASPERDAAIASAEKAFGTILMKEADRREAEISADRGMIERYGSMPDPARLYSPERQYDAAYGLYLESEALRKTLEAIEENQAGAALSRKRMEEAEKTIGRLAGDPSDEAGAERAAAERTLEAEKNAYEQLLASDAERKEAAAIRSRMSGYLNDILANNPGEADAGYYRDAILSGNAEDRDKAAEGLKRLAVMGDPLHSGEGVKCLAESAAAFPSRERATGLSIEYSDRMKSVLPTVREIEEARKRIRENTAFADAVRNPGVVKGILSIMGMGAENISRTLPGLDFSAGAEKDGVSREALTALHEAIGLEDSDKEAFIRDAKDLWADAAAESGIRRDAESVVAITREYGNTHGMANAVRTILVDGIADISSFRKEADLAAREVNPHSAMATPKEQLEYFAGSRFASNPMFAPIRSRLMDDSWAGKADESVSRSNREQFIADLRRSGTGSVVTEKRGRNGSVEKEADGSARLTEQFSVERALYAAAGRMGSVIFRGAGRLLLDRSENPDGMADDRHSAYLPDSPGIDVEYRNKSPILSVKPMQMISAEEARRRAEKDETIRSIVRGAGRTTAETPDRSTYVLDLHEVPGLKAETVLRALEEQLRKYPTRDPYAAEFFREGTARIISETAGIALISFEPVMKKSRFSDGMYEARFGEKMDRKGSHMANVRAALETVLRGYGFRTPDGIAVFHLSEDDGRGVLESRKKAAVDAMKKEIAARSAERLEELHQGEVRTAGLSDSYGRGGRG